MKFSRVISELFFPSGIKCVVCGDDLPEETRYQVCNRCKLSYNTKFCQRCGRAMKNMASYCDKCQNEKVDFDIARAPFVYTGEIKKLVYRLKYGGAKYLAEVLAQFMADTYHETDFTADIITCVPLHAKRLKKRGYNQAEEIAKGVAEILSISFVDTLDRIKSTTNLARLNKSDRAKEIEGAYVIKPDATIKGKNILLIDDVFTTGATTGECCKVLRKAKCGKIFILTFATSKIKPQLY